MKNNEKVYTLDEVKNIEVENKEEPTQTPFAAALREHSDELEHCATVEEMANKVEQICKDLDIWDKAHKKDLIYLRRYTKVEEAFPIIWNWILNGQYDNNWSLLTHFN